jgi:hypothetical protein
MRPYRASNRAPFGSILMLLIIALVVGAILGGILFAIEYFTSFYLVLMFPLLAGFLAGGALALGVNSGKVRSPLLAILFGLIAGVVILTTYHVASYYIDFRGDVRTELGKQGEPPTEAELDQFIDQRLTREYGEGGIMGYLRLVADEGFTITRTASVSANPIELQGDAVWIYWGVEMLVAAIAAAVAARGAAVQPFDEKSEQWYEPAVLIGKASKKVRKELVNAFKEGRYSDAGRLMTRGDIKYPALEVTVRRSPGDPSSDLYTALNFAQRQGRSSPIKTGLLSPMDMDAVMKGMSAAEQQAPPAPTGRR